jgi:putative redox protein
LATALACSETLSEEDRARLYDAVSRCPLHKLMTTTEVIIETAPLGDG